jgi:hypothetical protein
VQKQKQKQKQKIKLIKTTERKNQESLISSALYYLLNHTLKTKTLNLTITTFAEFNHSVRSIDRLLMLFCFYYRLSISRDAKEKGEGGGEGGQNPIPNQTRPILNSGLGGGSIFVCVCVCAVCDHHIPKIQPSMAKGSC